MSEHERILIYLRIFSLLYSSLLKWNVKVLPITLSWYDVLEVMGKYRLVSNDALIAATCKHYNIEKIATFDPNFKRVDFLEIITNLS